MLIMLKSASSGDCMQIRPHTVSPKSTGKFGIATHGDDTGSGHHSCHAKQHPVTLPSAADVTTCIVPIWVTSMTPSIPIQVAAHQLPAPPPRGSST